MEVDFAGKTFRKADSLTGGAEHNRTAILPAMVKKPKYRSSEDNAVDILEK
jgi:hypothetical protein